MLLSALVLLAGCGGPSTATTHSPTVTADDDFRFSPAEVEVARGPVTIVLRDSGSYPHNLSIPRLDRTSDTVTGSLGKRSTSLHLTIDRPGTYRFICTYHDKAGMAGTLVVR